MAATGISALGINAQALLWQVVNFAILLYVLRRFAYRPLLKTLKNRQQRIEESLRTAADLERTKAALEEEKINVIAGARQRAEAIVDAGEDEAQRIRERAEAAGHAEAERLVAGAQAKMGQQVNTVREALKRETLALVAAATEQVLHQKMDEQADQALIAQAVAQAQTALTGKEAA